MEGRIQIRYGLLARLGKRDWAEFVQTSCPSAIAKSASRGRLGGEYLLFGRFPSTSCKRLGTLAPLHMCPDRPWVDLGSLVKGRPMIRTESPIRIRVDALYLESLVKYIQWVAVAPANLRFMCVCVLNMFVTRRFARALGLRGPLGPVSSHPIARTRRRSPASRAWRAPVRGSSSRSSRGRRSRSTTARPGPRRVRSPT